MNEFQGQINDVLVVTELRGSYPNVPIAADVDYDGLISEDTRAGTQPVFITIPIGKAGVTSGNKRHYDNEFVLELERQTISKRPIGLMGHLSETDRQTAFPPEAVHWVGALREGDTLWGKAYVVPGQVRDRIQRYKAQGKAIATSIDAYAKGVWDEGMKAYRMAASSLKLNQIDIAPADRAGIADLAAVPILTTEMEGSDNDPDNSEDTQMDKLQVINEMTAEDARLLPTAVREAILATVQPAPEIELVKELRGALGVDDKANMVTLVTELQKAKVDGQKTAVTNHIKELVEDKEKGIKVESMRGMITELVTARNPQTVEEVEAVYTAVCEMQAVKDGLQAAVAGAMGPNITTPTQPQNGQAKYFNIPQEEGE